MLNNIVTLPSCGALSVKEFCRWTSLGRTAVYEEIARGKLEIRKVGRRTLIPFAEAQRWMNSLPTLEQALDQRDAIHCATAGSESP